MGMGNYYYFDNVDDMILRVAQLDRLKVWSILCLKVERETDRKDCDKRPLFSLFRL